MDDLERLIEFFKVAKELGAQPQVNAEDLPLLIEALQEKECRSRSLSEVSA